MRVADPERVRHALDARLALTAPPETMRFGRVLAVGPTLLRASLPGVGLGEACRLPAPNLLAEVVAIDGDEALLSPYALPLGVAAGDLVAAQGRRRRIALAPELVGRVVDGLGMPLDDGPPIVAREWREPEAEAPAPLSRRPIDTPLPLGVRAIDALLTCGRGQRVGIFAAAGGGKSSLLGMMCDGSLADVIVLALVGERGREVREFLELTLTPAARARAVVVVATSDRPALERLNAALTATTIAEYFRDQGHDVLLLVDSLTRFARAVREIGLAAGEAPGAGGYPASLFARLPRLLERAGPAARGSITGLYTVLVEGDDMNEPVADEVRSILDGHIVLSRRLAEAHHYPAIDVAASVSRVMTRVVSREHLRLAGRVRALMATWREIELLVRVGEYRAGEDAAADEALARRGAIDGLLRQAMDEKDDFATIEARLAACVEGAC